MLLTVFTSRLGVQRNGRQLYFKYFNENFWFDQSNPKIWEAIYNVPDEEIWKTRMTMKNKLVDYIRKSFRDTWLKNQGDPSRIVSLMDKINPNALLIGFGRRFATYKRAHSAIYRFGTSFQDRKQS